MMLWSLYGLIVLVSIPGQLFVNIGRIAIEKDWVPIVADTNSHLLTRLNTRLRIIDLSCKFLAPMAFGITLQYLGTDSVVRIRWGSLVVFMYNTLSAVPECICISCVYAAVPALSTAGVKVKGRMSSKGVRKNPFREFLEGWKIYFKHPIFLASLSFTLLFATVLSPGSLLLAYLKWLGLMEGLLGASIGTGAIFGLLGAWIFPYLRGSKEREKMKLEAIGLLSIWIWFAFIAPIGIVLVMKQERLVDISPINLGYILLFFVVVGRMWLWTFDLAENQLLQERVREDIRGRISSVQTGLSQLFTVVVYSLGLVFHTPEQFPILCYTSVSGICLSALCYTVWYQRYKDPRAFTEALPISINSNRTIPSQEIDIPVPVASESIYNDSEVNNAKPGSSLL